MRDGTLQLYGDEMGEKELTISIRMGTEDLQLMEDFMTEKGIDSRSHFVRDAIAGYISSQRSRSGGVRSEGGVFVRFREVQMEALRLMVEDGTAFDEEEYIRRCVLEKLVSPESEADSADRAFKAAQLASKMK
ncbi:MAG: ribbon-helix-helix domain-containing protein [Candidatus Methanoplasma sp.]|jgi:hypothetical protein|nr:ribbon-helix-helix domain-containing protein [Candidatus Methanoplasma sp.]